MKIAVIRKKYTFHGGAEGFSNTFVEAMADKGHEVHIFAIKWEACNTHRNVYFHRVPAVTFSSFFRDLSFAVLSQIMLKRQRRTFDIIQTHDKTLFQDIYRAGDGCHIEWLRQRWKRTGIAGKISIALNPYHWLILALERSIFKGRRFKKVIAISEMVKQDMIRNYSAASEDIEVIYNGVDLDKFNPAGRTSYRDMVRKEYGLSEDDFVVLFVGSGFERKGLRYLIEAVESIKEPVTVLIVGKGSEKKFQKISPDPSLPKRGNIIFCGPQCDIHKYYAAADIFVFPTMYEPFGNVHLEALASGLPVITTRNSGASEIISDGVQGFVIERPEDIDTIRDKIKFLVENPDKRHHMSQEARKRAEAFSFKRHIAQTLSLYKDLTTQLKGNPSQTGTNQHAQ